MEIRYHFVSMSGCPVIGKSSAQIPQRQTSSRLGAEVLPLTTERMFGIFAPEVFARMVFCKECKQKVEECPHFVDPIQAPSVQVFDPKIDTLAYSEANRILEITYKNGQVWQLFGVPPSIYGELRETTLTSFVKFIAQRYKAAPVKTGLKALKVPDSEKCSKCDSIMKVRHRINNPFDVMIRILWECTTCDHCEWRKYESGRQRGSSGPRS